MDSAKIVACFADGRIKKGYTRDFSQNKRILHIMKKHVGQPMQPEEVNLADLKAVFFVKTFAGDPDYTERNEVAAGDSPKGQKVEIAFADGEILQGSVFKYRRQETGFFFFPVDPKSNNLTLFVVNAAVKKFRYLRSYSITSPGKINYNCLMP